MRYLFSQVTELSPEETESMTGGYGKSISHVIIGLKTIKGTKQLKLDPTIYDALIKEKVTFANYIVSGGCMDVFTKYWKCCTFVPMTILVIMKHLYAK